MRGKGRLDLARRECERLLAEFPDYYAALHTLGLIASAQARFGEAVQHLSLAAANSPSNEATITALASVYVEMGLRQQAIELLQRHLATSPKRSPNATFLLGKAHYDQKEYTYSEQYFSEAVRAERRWHEARYYLAMSHLYSGDYRKAAQELEHLLVNGFSPLQVLSVLSEMPAEVFNESHYRAFDRIVPQRVPKLQEATYYFTRARFSHLRGDHDAVMPDLHTANGIRARESALLFAEGRIVETALLQHALGMQDVEGVLPLDHSLPISLLILGPSRSGKTTIEGLVGTGLGAASGRETSEFHAAVRQGLLETGYPSSTSIALLPLEGYAIAKSSYRTAVTRLSQGRPLFTATTPALINELPDLFRLVPNLHILFVDRDRYDLIWKIYSRDYNKGNYYAYNLNNVEAYVSWYREFSAQVQRLVPERVRSIKYETAIEAPQQLLQQLSEWLKIPVIKHSFAPIRGDVGCATPYVAEMKAQLAVRSP